MCGRLGVAKSRKDEMLDVLDELHALGLVTEMPGHRFRIKKQMPPPPPVAAEGTIEGVLTMNPRGFGFVSTDDGGDDVFIPPGAMGAALHGDRVEIIARPSPKGREGTVISVLQRRPERFTGTLERQGKQYVIQPDDPRLRAPVLLLGKPPKKKGSDQAIVARLARFPQGPDDLAAAEIVENLGVRGMTTVEVTKIKIRENVVEEFPEDVKEEAAAFPDRVPQRDKKGREDLRDVDLCTIDPFDARDHDDALFCERTKDGYRVVICIADVSHYVRPGTRLDEEALARSCSIYLPDRAIPMLPPELSSHLASLVPNKDRLCMGVEAELSKTGIVKHYRLFEGVMRSRGKLTYEGVARALDLTDEGPRQPAAEKRVDNLSALLELTRKLRKRRLRRGALDFDLPEPKVLLDDENVEPIDCRESRSDPGVREAYRMVEEMMLLANELVAGELKRQGVPAIYRVHGKPDEKKIGTFAQLASALGHDIDAEQARDPKQLSKFLRKIEGRDEAPVLRYLLLRAMQQASYDTNGDVGHFGLAAKDYLHFTSPIRRYPDMVVHRVVKKLLRGEAIDGATMLPKMRKAAAEASRLERRAMQVERDVVQLYRTILMRDRVGEEFEGRVSTVDHYGFRVALDDPYVEAMVPVNRLQDYYELDELGIRLIGLRSGRMFSMGDRVTVRIENVNVPEREITAIPLDAGLRDEEGEDRGRRRSRSSKQKQGEGQRRKRGGGGRGGQRKRQARREQDGGDAPKRRRTRPSKQKQAQQDGGGQKKRRRTRRKKR
ncbi:MAG TPA: ribonuclease R [Polyangiaceae bacterium LLY-WYZ-15_(1-7)]|nr:ribonuclease R [Polyangiaceae bacterium LLY-WYZ-15_(1-7)]HJL37962.1 ribonuclease R [Polyangiaceae bacterium LLY-WYZ-15_(1-7)]HJL45520.1 ribonuclease R [Polyangiaceae bacterium LLY-WYZ-15_(1-7)]